MARVLRRATYPGPLHAQPCLSAQLCMKPSDELTGDFPKADFRQQETPMTKCLLDILPSFGFQYPLLPDLADLCQSPLLVSLSLVTLTNIRALSSTFLSCPDTHFLHDPTPPQAFNTQKTCRSALPHRIPRADM